METGNGGPIAVLGGGSGQRPFLRLLAERNAEFVLLDANPNARCRSLAREFHNVSIYEYDACRRTLESIGRFSDIVTFATGPATIVCNRLRAHFGLKPRSTALAGAAVDKRVLSETLRLAELPTLREAYIQSENPDSLDLSDFPFPAIVKPIGGEGGRGVEVVENAQQFSRCCRTHTNCLLQEYLDGSECILFAIVRGGQVAAIVHGVNLFDPRDVWHGPIGVAMERLPVDDAPEWAERLIDKLVRAFDPSDEFIVAEIIRHSAGDFVIDVETNALAPFACSSIMDEDDLTGMLLDAYLGGPVRTSAPRWVSAMAFFVSDDPVKLQEMAAAAAEETQHHVEPAHDMTQLESPQYVAYKGGYVIVRGAASLEEASRTALEVFEGARRMVK